MSLSAPERLSVPAHAKGRRTTGERWNVLKIAPTSFFSDYGCHVRIYEEIRALQRLGHRVTVVTYHSGGSLPNVDIRRSLPLPWRRDVQVGSSIHRIYYDALLAGRALQVALSVRPNVIHAHLHEGALVGSVIGRLLGVPLVFDFQGSLTSEMVDHRFLDPESTRFGLFRWLESVITRLPAAIITSSNNAASLLDRDFGVPGERVATVADAVDPEVFRPRWLHPDPGRIDSIRESLGIPVGVPVIVYLGLLAEYQGTSKLIEAAAHLKQRGRECWFLIMGYPGVDTYQAIARDLGVADRTVFTGQLPYQDAPDYLLIGDIAVSPKMSETEGNGKLLNYQAVGLPTVTFDTPVAHEILGDLGVYAEFGSSISLADRIEQLLLDPAGRDRLGRQLRQHVVDEQSWDSAIQRILKIYGAVSEH